MNKTQPLVERVFSGTTILHWDVNRYLMDPQLDYAEYVINQKRKGDEYTIHLARAIERFEVQLRSHLAGTVGAEMQMGQQMLKLYTDFGKHGTNGVLVVLYNIQKTIMENQWYELMPRLEKISQQLRNNLKLWGYLSE